MISCEGIMSDNDTIKPARATESEQREDEEHLRQVDLDSGPDYIQQTEGAKEHKQKEEVADVNSFLEGHRQRKFSYRRDLAEYGNKLLPEVLDKGWEGKFLPTDGTPVNLYDRRFDTKEGVILFLKFGKEVYVRAVQLSMMAEVDSNAIRVLCEQAENTIDSKKGILLSDKKPNGVDKTKGGIYLN